MTTPADDAKKAQIESELRARYFPIIPQLPQNWTAEQHDKNRLSRALAAFAIEKYADVAPAQGANAVVDGGNDNGIDALHFDRLNNRLWVVQSKAGAAADMGENKKFCDGIRDLVHSRFHKFNASFHRLQLDVEAALLADELVIVGGQIHLSAGLGQHAIDDLNQLKQELNQFHQRFDWQDLSLSRVHEWLTVEHAVEPLRVTVVLEKWYGVDQPRRAFYGLISAEQLAAIYNTEGKRLFEKNIRHFLGAQGVNAAIADTVLHRPADLFYLNNGLTAVWTRITPAPGATHESGSFSLEGFSIVNGAQTVGAIATAHARAGGSVAADARLLITLIDVGIAPDNLGSQITQARNTQNAVRGLHFAALDPVQERLRREMAVSGIDYHYRPSLVARRGGPNQITLEQSALALGCFSGNTRTVVAAKKEVGQLHDRNGTIYSTLFRDGVAGIYLCRLVRIMEYVDGILAASESAETEFYRRAFYRHARYFIFHIIARRHRPLLTKTEITLSNDDKIELSRIAIELAELIYGIAEARFARLKGYLAIFRNVTDAEALAGDVMNRLAQLDAQQAAARQAAASTPPATPQGGSTP